VRKLARMIRSWFAPTAAQIRISRLSSKIDGLEVERRVQEKLLGQRASELQALAERIGQDVENARRTHVRYEVALEEVREQNRVLEMTIQTLVASHKLLQERYDTETAIQVRNRVALSAQIRE
jgi:hypothetical protein